MLRQYVKEAFFVPGEASLVLDKKDKPVVTPKALISSRLSIVEVIRGKREVRLLCCNAYSKPRKVQYCTVIVFPVSRALFEGLKYGVDLYSKNSS